MSEETKKEILIVEDDEFLRSLTVKRLSDEYNISTAIDGENALSFLKENKPDLILLDLLLPGVNGFEVLEQVKIDENTKNIPVIVFSNLGQREDLEKAKELGADDFLIKANFTLDDVIEKIKNHLF